MDAFLMIDSYEQSSRILRRIESEHQEIKRAYFRKFGRAGIGSHNNGITLHWLDRELTASNLKTPPKHPLTKAAALYKEHIRRNEKGEITEERTVLHAALKAALKGKVTPANARLYLKQLRAMQGHLK